MVQASRGQKLCLSGDGRADSPGHFADFGTYTLMDVNRNRVFHIELVKVQPAPEFIPAHFLGNDKRDLCKLMPASFVSGGSG